MKIETKKRIMGKRGAAGEGGKDHNKCNNVMNDNAGDGERVGCGEGEGL